MSGKAIPPTTRLMWPELQDDHLENSRKVPLGKAAEKYISAKNVNVIYFFKFPAY